MSISHNTICSTSSVISNSETFYYLLEWFEKPQRTQRDTEKKSNASLCPPCPLWLIFFAMINSSEYIKKSPNSPEIIYLFSSPAAFRARARSGHRQRGGCGVRTGSERESRAPAAFFAALNPPPPACELILPSLTVQIRENRCESVSGKIRTTPPFSPICERESGGVPID